MNDTFVLFLCLIAVVAGFAAITIAHQILHYRALYRHLPLGMHPIDAKVVYAVSSAVRFVFTRCLMIWQVLTKRHLIVLHYDEKNDSGGGVATLAPRRERMWPSYVTWHDMPRDLFLNPSVEHSDGDTSTDAA